MIIVSLIDVLIVVLIFMMVATTFKQQPALKLALPEAKQSGTADETANHLIVTIARQEPHLYLGQQPVTLERLQRELEQASRQQGQISLSIRADTEAPFGQIVKVMDAAKSAGIRMVNAFTKNPGTP